MSKNLQDIITVQVLHRETKGKVSNSTLTLCVLLFFFSVQEEQETQCVDSSGKRPGAICIFHICGVCFCKMGFKEPATGLREVVATAFDRACGDW
ncbi:hypothetical protein BS78_02G043200 [Paspalum vaginatum]|nr:hypothetical protein BS78_02G043200 [Paspalum vaginatum]